MPPFSNPKRLGELHLVAALRKDFLDLLSALFNGNDLSFAEFKYQWKVRSFGEIHNCKTEKIGYKAYLQLLYESVLLLLRSNRAFGGDMMPLPIQSIGDNTTRNSIWNVGVIYCLYTIYCTQCKSNLEPHSIPVHIGPDTALILSSAVQQLSSLAEFGRTAVSMYQTMLKAEAFRFCAYTGPTSLFYCQKAAKKASARATAASRSSSSSGASSISALSNPDLDPASVHAIREVYCMRASVSASAAGESTNSPGEVATTAEAEETERELDVRAEASQQKKVEITTQSSNAPEITPPELSVTEYLTQSIPERRQMRADKAKERQAQQAALAAARLEKLRGRVLRRLEKHDIAEAPSPELIVKDKPASKRGPRRTYAMRLLEESAQQDAARQAEADGGAARSSRRSTADAQVAPRTSSSAPLPRQRTRASSKEQSGPSTNPRLVPTGRHVTETHVGHDNYLQENDDLMQDFEEFVGLRPKSTRTTTSSTSSNANIQGVAAGGVRATRSSARAEPQAAEEPEVYLDAATGDIMDILRQLEQDSERVLQRGSGRALRSTATVTTSAPSASTAQVRQARNASSMASVTQTSAHENAPRRVSAQTTEHSSEHRATGFGGLELREVNKKRKTQSQTTAAVPASKRARACRQRDAAEEEGEGEDAPLAADDIMGMLQRLERESDRILSGAPPPRDDNDVEDSPPRRPVRSNNRRNEASRSEETASRSVEPKARAAPKRRVPLRHTATDEDDSALTQAAPPTKKPRAQSVQRNVSARSPVTAVPVEVLSAESSDIMALLQRLEQESDQILGGEEQVNSETSVPADTSPAVIQSNASKKTKQRAPQTQADPLPVPSRTTRQRGRATAPDMSSSPLSPSPSPPSVRVRATTPKKASTATNTVTKTTVKTAAPKRNNTTAAHPARTKCTVVGATSRGDTVATSAQRTNIDSVEAGGDGDADSGGMDILEMLKRLEDEANGILTSQV